MSYVDVEHRPSTIRVWTVRGVLCAMLRLVNRLAALPSSGMESLSEQWCQQYEVDSAKH